MSSEFARSEMERRVSRLRARMAERPAGPHNASAKGLSLGETVLVAQEGPRRLTQTPRTLFET
jgi:hypothetical protein